MKRIVSTTTIRELKDDQEFENFMDYLRRANVFLLMQGECSVYDTVKLQVEGKTVVRFLDSYHDWPTTISVDVIEMEGEKHV